MKFKMKDPGSAITHLIGCIMAVLAAAPLLLKAAREPDKINIIAMGIFILSMILLYAASTIYHTVDSTEKVNRRLRKMDHMMIFILIAGSYTPVCLIVLQNMTGYVLCAAVWAVALIGIIVKACWITCPKWFSSVIYIGMGWLCVFAFIPIVRALSPAGFGWLLAGGIIYTIGGIIYALKLPIFNSRHKNFGSHEIFHLFVMGGSICHFIVMYFFVMPTGI
ncbi:MAG TPA: hemolysin III family protein [Candidatus Blautia merdavium]|uniref:Hemolysin III family protein n=1 Tax=Candidatus Blautia merdavium TaxID=2838494 RepID=A0A9D2PNZ3_9FIRM|nr:hemolysin III family protein [Candidatus Blautia merdavium]